MVVVTRKMKDAVDDVKVELMAEGRAVDPGLADGGLDGNSNLPFQGTVSGGQVKGQDIGGVTALEEPAVEDADRPVVHKNDA